MPSSDKIQFLCTIGKYSALFSRENVLPWKPFYNLHQHNLYVSEVSAYNSQLKLTLEHLSFVSDNVFDRWGQGINLW